MIRVISRDCGWQSQLDYVDVFVFLYTTDNTHLGPLIMTPLWLGHNDEDKLTSQTQIF